MSNPEFDGSEIPGQQVLPLEFDDDDFNEDDYEEDGEYIDSGRDDASSIEDELNS